MKTIALLFGILVILGCGDEEQQQVKTLLVTVENPPEVKTVEVEKTYDSEIDKVYSDLREHLTAYEYRFLLQEVKRHCSENLTDTHVLRRLKDELSPTAYELLLKPTRIPKWRLTDLNRVKLAAHLKNATAITRITGKVVYVFQYQNTIIVKQTKSCCPDHYWVGAEEFYGEKTYNPLVHDLAHEIETLNAPEGGLSNADKPFPIKLPDDILDGIDIVVLDEFANPMPPTPDWYYEWIFDYADAPRATDEEIEDINYTETPLAFDCFGDN